LPEIGIDFVQPVVEAAFADHLWHIAILTQEPAGFIDVGAEEGCGYQGNAHNLGGCEPNLRIVEAAHGLQEVVTQAVDGGYGIVQVVLPIQKRLCGLRIGRILSIYLDRGQLGLGNDRRPVPPRYHAHDHETRLVFSASRDFHEHLIKP
jgi:hypothetical protein